MVQSGRKGLEGFDKQSHYGRGESGVESTGRRIGRRSGSLVVPIGKRERWVSKVHRSAVPCTEEVVPCRECFPREPVVNEKVISTVVAREPVVSVVFSVQEGVLSRPEEPGVPECDLSKDGTGPDPVSVLIFT